ncbi:MAG: uracil-DNA glycosylase family protein [Candidatus Bathyarchaeota archaeon]|nr:uracil-DNA glycosylase family protein [Candidatus Bathyarchaeota archaeon]
MDTIKCRLNKSIKKKVLYRIAKTCSKRFLLKEIKQLKPNTVFILGNTAKYALEQTADFEELVQHRITQNYDTSLSGYRVIVCPFPGGLTRKWTNEIDSAFMKIR